MNIFSFSRWKYMNVFHEGHNESVATQGQVYINSVSDTQSTHQIPQQKPGFQVERRIKMITCNISETQAKNVSPDKFG